MDPNHPGYPAPSQGNLQQFPYYPNQMPSFPQSNASSQPFNAVPLQPGGAMMPPSFPQQSPGVFVPFFVFPVSSKLCCARFSQDIADINLVPLRNPHELFFFLPASRYQWLQSANHLGHEYTNDTCAVSPTKHGSNTGEKPGPCPATDFCPPGSHSKHRRASPRPVPTSSST